jgi:Putative DNA-binding domain
MTPLTPSDRMRGNAPDGRSLANIAKKIIKPNDRLTSFERLEIYNRQYWFRVLDGFSDDFRGLRAVLGDRRFDALARHYLTDCPSRSFTMRDLGSRLESWLCKHANYAPGRFQLALDMVRLEWAEIETFDAASEPRLTAASLVAANPGRAQSRQSAGDRTFRKRLVAQGESASPAAISAKSVDPTKLRLRLQPYIRLLDLHYPVDDLLLAIKQDAPTDIASNAMEERHKRKKVSVVARLKPSPVYLAIHRLENTVYLRRLEREEFTILKSLSDGRTLERAIVAAFRGSKIPASERPQLVAAWFQNWSSLGWFVV